MHESDNHSDPTERVFAALRRLGYSPKRGRENSYRSRCPCPAHPDKRSSLSVTRKPDRVLIHCFGSCQLDQILLALGLERRDLFSNHPKQSVAPSVRRQEVAVYPYEDEDGRLLAEKVRYEPKDFAWRRPST